MDVHPLGWADRLFVFKNLDHANLHSKGSHKYLSIYFLIYLFIYLFMYLFIYLFTSDYAFV